ncbi:18298_t:CDS:2 [Dentiscutata erythropus]|uniref:18298_t:CDS:1 n=1 Tax=Dentiscutata erythropus TaxID=1348616 RepID=A0A9N9AY54_9GLOM|nr:18298_t:CDS:2 [Dentiscutata erythropus]
MPDDDDIVSIVNRSTTVNLNVAQRYLNGEGFHYYDFKIYFQAFKKLPNIQKYYHFYFTSQYPGVIFYKDSLEDNYKTFTIRSFSFDSNILPPTINTKPLSIKRQEELYKEIVPYVDLPFHNITCPKPEELKTS